MVQRLRVPCARDGGARQRRAVVSGVFHPQTPRVAGLHLNAPRAPRRRWRGFDGDAKLRGAWKREDWRGHAWLCAGKVSCGFKILARGAARRAVTVAAGRAARGGAGVVFKKSDALVALAEADAQPYQVFFFPIP